jgi:hypothetical protein
MKSAALLKSIYKDCLERGYILVGDNLYPPNHPNALRTIEVRSKRKTRVTHIKTGWVDDTRNIKNKLQRDMFVILIEKELGVDLWPEFFFSTERLFRFDYCIPVLKDGTIIKLAIEQEGGIFMRGNSGHSSGTGIERDMTKSSLAASQGWLLIRRTPQQMLTTETIAMIKSVINQKST